MTDIKSFILGTFFTLVIVVATILAFKLELKPQYIPVENRTPDQAYVDVVSKTEYYGNETGQVIIRTSDYLGNPLNATCNASIIFPNKTFWYIDTSLSPSSITGNYYKEVTIPDVLGVYEYSFTCDIDLYGKSVTVKRSSSFHVSIAYQKFQEIIDKLDALNNTLIQINQTNYEQYQNLTGMINNLSYNMNNNFTYTNSLIQNISVYINMTNVTDDIKTNITIQINDLKSWTDNWFKTIETDIFNLEQRWIDLLNNLLMKLLGTSKSLQDVVGQTTGVTPTPDCSLLNRILGTCP
jgi:hypothetical protein